MTPQWVKYDGSDEQIYEIMGSKYGFITEDNVHIECTSDCIIPDILSIGDKYLLCDHHPYADMICQWARTGQPVYARAIGGVGSQECHEYFPPFAHPDTFEYSFTSFEEEV